MALPLLELFSLRKRLPRCRVASSSFKGRLDVVFFGMFVGLCVANVGSCRGISASGAAAAGARDGRLFGRADVAQLVEQLIRNQ